MTQEATGYKVGLVGSGHIAMKEHLPGAITAGGEVIAVADTAPGVAAQKAAGFGIAHAYDNAEDLIANPEVDVVAICTPAEAHREVALAAIAAGKHVFMEKPPTTSAAEIREVAAAAKAKGVALIAGSHHPYRENVTELKNRIAGGEFGQVYAVDCFKLRRDACPADRGNVKRRGGAGSGSSVHRIDVSLYLLGNPKVKSVTARTYHYFSSAKGEAAGCTPTGLVDDAVLATIHFENGCTLTLRDIHNAHMAEPNFMQCWFGEITLFGTLAGAQLHPLTIYQNQSDGSQRVDVPLVNNDLNVGHVPAYRHLFECIRQGKPVEGSCERAVATMEIIDAIYESASRDGEQVRF